MSSTPGTLSPPSPSASDCRKLPQGVKIGSLEPNANVPTLAMSPSPSRARRLDIILTSPGQHDRSRVRELPRDREHFLLRFHDLDEPHRPARFDLVANRIRRPTRHAAE